MFFMKNLNKLVLKSVPNTQILSTDGFSSDLDSVVNDLGRPLNIVAILAGIAQTTVSPVANGSTTIDTAIGTQNAYDRNTNLFNWKHVTSFDTLGNPNGEQSWNHLLGNFKDTLFTLGTFSSEVSGGNAEKGELFLNVARDGFSGTFLVDYKAYITLFYT